MRVSGHSQLPVAGLKARPGSQGIPFAVTREQTPGGPGGGRTCRAEGWGGSSRLACVWGWDGCGFPNVSTCDFAIVICNAAEQYQGSLYFIHGLYNF